MLRHLHYLIKTTYIKTEFIGWRTIYGGPFFLGHLVFWLFQHCDDIRWCVDIYIGKYLQIDELQL